VPIEEPVACREFFEREAAAAVFARRLQLEPL
jgi:hypothetical protein